MPWTTPRTWVAGELVTAGLLNTHLRDNLLDLDGRTGAIVLDRDVVLVEVVNTTTETVVYSKTIAGGTLGSTAQLQILAMGDHFNNSGGANTLTIRVKYGGTTFLTFTIVSNSNANRAALLLDAVLSALNATNAQWARGTTIVPVETNSAGGSASQTNAAPHTAVRNSLAIDSTVNQTLEITFQHSNASANISAKMAVVVLLKLP